jgi:hypothetical protein
MSESVEEMARLRDELREMKELCAEAADRNYCYPICEVWNFGVVPACGECLQCRLRKAAGSLEKKCQLS